MLKYNFSDPVYILLMIATPNTNFGRAIFHIASTRLFWLCLLGIIIAAILPRFVVKFLYQNYSPCDVQIAKEFEKFGNPRESANVQIEMNPILDQPHR